MAPTTWEPRRVTSDEDRTRFATDYISLDPGEAFTGHALFVGDPSKAEPGYYEYFEHWDTGGPGRKGGSVPCAGDDCLFCNDGDRPRGVAKALFFVLRDNAGTEVNAVRTLDMRPRLIKQFTGFRKEGEPIKGRVFTVKKEDGDGNWTLIPKSVPKALPATEVKEHLKNAPNFANALGGKIKAYMQAQGVDAALADDTPDDGSAPPTGAKGGKGGKGAAPAAAKGGKGGKAAAAKAEWPGEAEDATVTITETSVDGVNKMEVVSEEYDGATILWGTGQIDTETFAEGEIVTASWAVDGDGDFVLSALDGTAEPEAEPEPEASDDPNAFDPSESDEADGVIVKVGEAIGDLNYINVESTDGNEFAVYGTADVNLLAFSEGDFIALTAAKDGDGDWVASAADEAEAPDGGGAAVEPGDLPDSIEDVVVVVTDGPDLVQQTIDVENDELGLSFKLWFLSDGPAGGKNVDINNYPVGTKIKVTAEKDRMGDLVATVVPEIIGGAKGGKGAAPKGAKGGKGSK